MQVVMENKILIDYASQLLCGLAYLHAAQVVLRDIKPANVLLRLEGDQVVLKLSDFGVSITCPTVALCLPLTICFSHSFFLSQQV